MCEESPANMIKSVLPIMTKCKLVAEDDDENDDKVDLEIVKGTLTDCFSDELQRKFKDLHKAFPDL